MAAEEKMESPWLSKLLRRQSESGTEHIHFPAECTYLPEEYELYARTKLNETEENKQEGMKKLKDFVKKEKLLCPDDNHLTMVLRCCKYNIKKSESKLKRFLKIRQIIIGQLSKQNMETIEQVVDDIITCALPYRDRHGRLVFYSRPYLQTEKYSWECVGYVGLAGMLLSLQFPMTQVCGVTYIGDNFSPSLSVYYPILKIFKNLCPLMVDMPCRFGRIDITNEHFLARWLFALVRPVLPLKIFNRVTFHGSDFKNLHAHYSADLIPENVGGKQVLTNHHYREDFLNFIKKLRSENLSETCC